MRRHSRFAIEVTTKLRWSAGSSYPLCAAVDVKSKTNQIRNAWNAGDRIGALRIAARFFDRSDDTLTFKRGMAAHNHPGFYREIGKEPAQIVAEALALLAWRFDLHLASVGTSSRVCKRGRVTAAWHRVDHFSHYMTLALPERSKRFEGIRDNLERAAKKRILPC